MTHPILARLKSRDPEERRAACRAAVDDPSALFLLESLCEALGDPAKAVARAASDALVALASQTQEVRELLRRALHGNDARQRFGAAYTTARLTPPTPALLPAVVEAMGSPDGDIRWTAAKLMVDLGRIHPEVVGVNLRLVGSAQDPVVRRMATFSLQQLSPDHPTAGSVLLEAAGDEDLHVRRAALTAMASLVDPPERVLVRLVSALTADPDSASRRIAALALGEIGAAHPGSLRESALRELRAAGDHATDSDLQRATERALRRIGAA